MSPEAQRIAIAEWCGWSVVAAPKPDPDWPDSTWNIEHNGKRVDSFRWWDKKLKKVPSIPTLENCVQGLPDYLNDLNAMHEAEKKLTAQQAITYSKHVRMPYEGQRHYLHTDFDMLHATAAQRAEALLRSIHKWQDAPQEKQEK